MSVELSFSVAGTEHTITVFRSVSEATSSADIDGTDVPFVVNEKSNLIRVTVPRSTLGDVKGSVAVSGLHSYVRRDTGVVLAPVADEGGGSCPVTINLGS